MCRAGTAGSERAENRREKGSQVCSCSQGSSACRARASNPALGHGPGSLCSWGHPGGGSRAMCCIWNICSCLCYSCTFFFFFFFTCGFFFSSHGWNVLCKAECKCMQRAPVSPWNLHKQVIWTSYVKKITGGVKKMVFFSYLWHVWYYFITCF